MNSMGLVATAVIMVCAAITSHAAGSRPTRREVRRPTPRTSVVKIVSGGESIPVIRVAPGLTTMLSLPDEAREAVCGDLFDPATGTGGFVIQRSGRDLFVKPLKSSGASNLFVKTPSATFAFEIVVVEQSSAMRIVQVDAAAPDIALTEIRNQLQAERARAQAEVEQVGRRIAVLTEERDAARREAASCESRAAADSIDTWLTRARLIPVAHRSATEGAVLLDIGPCIVASGSRALLAITIRNRGKAPLVVGSIDARDGAVRANPVNTAIPPSSSSTYTIDVPVPLTNRLEITLLDPSGRRLCTARPLK